MKRVYIEFEVLVKEDATNQQIEEWVNFVTGYSGSMRADNPLADQDLESNFMPIIDIKG